MNKALDAIRKAIEEAKPVEEYFTEQAKMRGEKAEDAALPDLRSLSLQYAALKNGDENSLNDNERKSVTALIAYAAYDKGMHEAVVKELVETRFSVDDFRKIQSRDYDDVIRYLVDFDFSEAVN